MDLPPEYVLHLLPLMAICGLSPTQQRDRSPSPILQRTERTTSIGSEKSNSPRPTPTLASIPYIDPSLSRSILAYIDQWRTLALWEPFAARDRQVPGASLEGIFRVVPVDRVVPSLRIVANSQSFRLPPQKTGVPGGNISVDKELHSPLSPLNPESPLYPDGIMTTMWIRKHRDIIPAVFVSFYDLKSEERSEILTDEELARHLAELKKSLADRGVKLCAVLTGPWEPEDMTTRLDYLRRNSSLDSKTGLFYLPPPTHKDSIPEFFKTLRQSQYPFALEHYRLRFNKAKRRRPRIPAPLPNLPAPLDSRGWTVRTNFKLAAYSEYKQELDVAIKFYEISYNELIELFSSTAILPPRSKRWAEARVLADSISYKLWKLYLYLGDHSRVIQTFNNHNRRMSVLCNGWGLGVETAEYWHWLSRNYRILADLLDISETIIVNENEVEWGIKMITGDAIWNAELILHHPGYYYLFAANCIRQKYAKLAGREVSAETKESETGLNLRMFEDLSLSVEQFQKRGSRRIAAYVELAKCKSHHLNGKYDVALELLQPVMKIYRVEKWYELLEEALVLALDCARKLEDEANVQRYSLELLSDEFPLTENGENVTTPSFIASEDFTQVSSPGTSKKPTIELAATNFVSFVKPSFAFQSNSAFAGSSISFQFSLFSRCRQSLPKITFSSARLSFNEQIPEIQITHADADAKSLQKLRAGTTTGTADLSIRPGQTKTFEMSYTPTAQAQIEAVTLSLSLETENYIFILQYPLAELGVGTSIENLWYTESKQPKSLRHGNARLLTVHPKPPKVVFSTTLHGPAYTGEILPILITLENGETEPVSLEIQFTFPTPSQTQSPVPSAPTPNQDQFSWQPSSSQTIQDQTLILGTLSPSEQRNCTLLFKAPLDPTESTLNLIIKYTLDSDRLTEIRKPVTIEIPVIQPFHTTFDIFPYLSEGGRGMPDPFGGDEYPLKVEQVWSLISSITRFGAENLEVRKIKVDTREIPEGVALKIDEMKGCSSNDDKPIGKASAAPELIIVLDTTAHTAETWLSLTRPEDTETTLLHLNLSVTWRRQSSTTDDWNTLTIPVPELTFFPFAPRILADVTPHNLIPEYPQYLVTFTFENPIPHMLNLQIHLDISEDCAFAGPKFIRAELLPFTSYVVKTIIFPIDGEWIKLPRLSALDDERKRTLEVLRLTDDLKIEGLDLFLRNNSIREEA